MENPIYGQIDSSFRDTNHLYALQGALSQQVSIDHVFVKFEHGSGRRSYRKCHNSFVSHILGMEGAGAAVSAP